ncbi:hypothetical protein AAG570_008680 [Ranatra chinensis]|uniref:Uncharacterized protein n=1 Tax=Ranatra chinensis TaxID=642074 RepID=A0ABD0YRP1_9HEMI
MATEVIRSKMETSLRISRVEEKPNKDEDVAVLSSFLPPSMMAADPSSRQTQQPFACSLGKQCRLGDPKLTTPGSTLPLTPSIERWMLNPQGRPRHDTNPRRGVRRQLRTRNTSN